jgi:hypothetical protein
MIWRDKADEMRGLRKEILHFEKKAKRLAVQKEKISIFLGAWRKLCRKKS